MHLPECLLRQPLLNDFWFFFAVFSQLSDGFLAFPKMIRLVVNLIHF